MLKSGRCTVADYDSRGKRRDAVKTILACLSQIRDAELSCLARVPENFRVSESFEAGECAVDALDEIIGLLVDVY